MLPSNLLRAKISKGKIRPLYVALDSSSLALAETITGTYRNGVGKRKGEVLERLKAVENEGHDFKLVRGLSTSSWSEDFQSFSIGDRPSRPIAR